MRRKKNINRQTLIVNNIKKSKTSKRNSNRFNLKLADDSFSSNSKGENEDMNKSVNSFHSSHLFESNNNIQQSNNDNKINERNNSGYEAPLIQNVIDNNDIINNIKDNEIIIDNNNINHNEEDNKIMTNEGNDNDNKNNIKLLDNLENPY